MSLCAVCTCRHTEREYFRQYRIRNVEKVRIQKLLIYVRLKKRKLAQIKRCRITVFFVNDTTLVLVFVSNVPERPVQFMIEY